jgi:hypothetical protein
MRAVLLGLAAASLTAIAMTAAPAQAEKVGRVIPEAKVFGVPGTFGRNFAFQHRNMNRDHVRMHRGRSDGNFSTVDGGGGWWQDNSEWALYNNRSWEPDSYNDWWHDRPDRAYPRWVQATHNSNSNFDTCDPNRMWWSGAGWRC